MRTSPKAYLNSMYVLFASPEVYTLNILGNFMLTLVRPLKTKISFSHAESMPLNLLLSILYLDLHNCWLITPLCLHDSP